MSAARRLAPTNPRTSGFFTRLPPNVSCGRSSLRSSQNEVNPPFETSTDHHAVYLDNRGERLPDAVSLDQLSPAPRYARLGAFASGANACQVASQPADPDHDLLEPSTLDAPTPVTAVSPVAVHRTQNSRSDIVSVSLAAILAAPSISA
jgi:hypothetical protein